MFLEIYYRNNRLLFVSEPSFWFVSPFVSFNLCFYSGSVSVLSALSKMQLLGHRCIIRTLQRWPPALLPNFLSGQPRYRFPNHCITPRFTEHICSFSQYFI
ncbi:hypothetical protein AMECASPLE_005645 [Ameca splendens]|uniref:Uncharacterized protein n=1 Tax=Ameca splendens TaxID=208324 RepID=A0ABV0YLA2_9TELE